MDLGHHLDSILCMTAYLHGTYHPEAPLPRFVTQDSASYNHQADGSSCGFFVSLYVELYLQGSDASNLMVEEPFLPDYRLRVVRIMWDLYNGNFPEYGTLPCASQSRCQNQTVARVRNQESALPPPRRAPVAQRRRVCVSSEDENELVLQSNSVVYSTSFRFNFGSAVGKSSCLAAVHTSSVAAKRTQDEEPLPSTPPQMLVSATCNSPPTAFSRKVVLLREGTTSLDEPPVLQLAVNARATVAIARIHPPSVKYFDASSHKRVRSSPSKQVSIANTLATPAKSREFDVNEVAVFEDNDDGGDDDEHEVSVSVNCHKLQAYHPHRSKSRKTATPSSFKNAVRPLPISGRSNHGCLNGPSTFKKDNFF